MSQAYTFICGYLVKSQAYYLYSTEYAEYDICLEFYFCLFL